MAIWLTKDSRVIVAGVTGSEGSKHTRRMLRAGTNIVGGTNPRKAGTRMDFDGTAVPVFGGVAEAMKETGADVSVIFVPPAFAKAAMTEAIDAQIPLAVVITEGIPGHDSTAAWAYNMAHRNRTPTIGPNCPGLPPPGQPMGHAGAIISGSSGTADAKKDALEAAGVKVGKTPSETARLMRDVITSR